MIFSPITGSTQGMKLSMKPPTKASSRIQPMEASSPSSTTIRDGSKPNPAFRLSSGDGAVTNGTESPAK